MVAEKIAEPCKHSHCGNLTKPDLGLVSKCYKEFPKPSIDNSADENPPYESLGCCEIID